MGYRVFGMVVWNGLKWVARRKARRSSGRSRVKYAAGVAIVLAVFAYVLTRSEGQEAESA
jgi:hypothetical protein